MKITLETERLILRRFSEDDAADLFALDGDPEVMRYVGPQTHADPEGWREHIRTKWMPYYDQRPGIGFWAAVEKANGAFLGWFHLRPALDYRFAAEAGYRAGDMDLGYRLRQAAWGNGYATEAARALVHKAFTELGAARVVAAALAANLASVRVMEKVGLKWVRACHFPGFDPPGVIYALSREEYGALASL